MNQAHNIQSNKVPRLVQTRKTSKQREYRYQQNMLKSFQVEPFLMNKQLAKENITYKLQLPGIRAGPRSTMIDSQDVNTFRVYCNVFIQTVFP